MKQCPTCSKSFKPLRSSSRYCSRPCMWAQNGKHNLHRRKPESWYLGHKGYVMGHVWIGDRKVLKKQHRWIMEQHIGRPLLADEDVHHLNGVRDDNRLENLCLITHSEHSTLTGKTRIVKSGYKLNLSAEERERRSLRARNPEHFKRRSALSRARGGVS